MEEKDRVLQRLHELKTEHTAALGEGPGEAPGVIQDEQLTRKSYDFVVRGALHDGLLNRDDLWAEGLSETLEETLEETGIGGWEQVSERAGRNHCQCDRLDSREVLPVDCHVLGLAYAEESDARDPLHSFRERFYVRPGQIYLDGNSLGLLSRDAEAAVQEALDDWKQFGIDGWTSGDRPWFYMAETLGALQAGLMGARPEELAVTGTTTVNLHTLVATFYQPAGRRTKILADELNFPSDLYALASQVRLRGYDPAVHLVLAKSRDGRTLATDDLIAAMTDDVALVVLPGVLYRSGQLLDMEALTRAAHARGIPIGFDCCHSAGSVPHRLHDWDVDFAFWCNYKYLNGGPGAVGSLFVHERHFGRLPGLAGWFGSHKERQFDMSPAFTPAQAAGAWQISTTPVLGAAALYGSLRLFAEAGMDRLRAKSLAQTDYLMFLIDELLTGEPYNFSIGNPREADRRGGHVALEHPDAVRICKALKARGIVPDFRPPNVVRLAPVALYTSYVDLWKTVQTLRAIIDTGEYQQFSGDRGTVA
ncbi:MAG TPA: kynureninase [Symbiobacteriaceae bacterium]|jgi:kynureninase